MILFYILCVICSGFVCFQYLNLMGFFYVFEGRFDNEIMILSDHDNNKI